MTQATQTEKISNDCGRMLEEEWRWNARNTHLVESPLNFVYKHAVHVRHNLDGHVDEPFRKDETDMVCGVWAEESLKFGVKDGVGR